MSLILNFSFFLHSVISYSSLTDLLASRLSAHTLSGCVSLPKSTSLLHWYNVFWLRFCSTCLRFRFCRVVLIRMTGQWQQFRGERWWEFAVPTVIGWCGSYCDGVEHSYSRCESSSVLYMCAWGEEPAVASFILPTEEQRPHMVWVIEEGLVVVLQTLCLLSWG